VAGRRIIFAGGRIDWNEGQVRILLSGPQGEVSTEIRRRATAVQKRAQRAAPMRTGTLKHSIHVNTRYPPEGAVAEVTADADHAVVVEFGRGESKARTGSALHWDGSGLDVGGQKFSMWAGPVPAVYYMRDALDAFED
jgi:hypothetical protein